MSELWESEWRGWHIPNGIGHLPKVPFLDRAMLRLQRLPPIQIDPAHLHRSYEDSWTTNGDISGRSVL